MGNGHFAVKDDHVEAHVILLDGMKARLARGDAVLFEIQMGFQLIGQVYKEDMPFEYIFENIHVTSPDIGPSHVKKHQRYIN